MIRAFFAVLAIGLRVQLDMLGTFAFCACWTVLLGLIVLVSLEAWWMLPIGLVLCVAIALGWTRLAPMDLDKVAGELAGYTPPEPDEARGAPEDPLYPHRTLGPHHRGIEL